MTRRDHRAASLHAETVTMGATLDSFDSNWENAQVLSKKAGNKERFGQEGHIVLAKPGLERSFHMIVGSKSTQRVLRRVKPLRRDSVQNPLPFCIQSLVARVYI